MNLEPRAGEPGLWVNPAWQEGEPGLFVVIIGVSQYRHLNEGTKPAPETYDLGQLKVSALTAFRVFQWLDSEYLLQGCAVAKCWVLLAPTSDEKAHEPKIAEHLCEPTFAACEKDIGELQRSLKQLPPAAAEQSRSLFFFSGHGLEIHQKQQILLPSDYLAPPAHNWDRALSTENLTAGLASLLVPKQFFFLDACRNDHQKLRSKNVRGSKVLPEDEAAEVNSALVAPVLYATASGHQAWQQPEPAKGLSLFGTALLEGLKGTPDIELRHQNDHRYIVSLYPLEGYVKRRVPQQLIDAGAQVVQPVKFGGVNVNDEWLTSLAAAPAVPGREGGVVSKGKVEAFNAGPPVPIEVAERLLDGAFTETHDVPFQQPRSVWARDFSIGHHYFGSESATQTWSEGLGLFGLGARWRLDSDAVVVHRVERHVGEGVASFRVEVSVNAPDAVGYWLELKDPSGDSHACVLPADRAFDRQLPQPRYLVEFDLDGTRPDVPKSLTRLEASLSRRSPHSVLGMAALMWQGYRAGELGQAVQRYQGQMLEDMVCHKRESALAATVAGVILLRANRLDLLHDWLRNLADWFPEGSDAPVLWAEQLMRTRAGDKKQAAEKKAAQSLLRLGQRGLPLTSDGLSYAASLLERFARPSAPLTEEERKQLAGLQERVVGALCYFRPGGLFCSYSGFAGNTDPIALLGLAP